MKRIAPACIICAAICWGIIGIFSKVLSGYGMNPVQITFLRCSVTMIALVIFTTLFKRSKFKIALRDIWMFIGTGVVGVALLYVFYFATIERGTLSIASVLLYTAPTMVMVLSCLLFKEKITAKKITALVMATVGGILATGIISSMIGGTVGQVSPLGIITGVCAGFCYANYTIIGNAALKKYEPLTVITYSFIAASICLFPFCEPVEMVGIIQAENLWVTILALGLLCTLSPYALYTSGLKHIEPGKASVMAFVEPMVATLVSVFIFHEGLTTLGGIGIGLIFISVALLNINFKGKRIS